METFCDDQDEKDKSLNLITHVEVEPDHNSDANAIVPAIEATEEHEVKLIAPAMGAVDQDKLSIADFQLSEKGQIIACPIGHAPAKVKKRKKTSIGFASQYCDHCPQCSSCPVKKGWKYYYLRCSDKEIRIAQSRLFEHSKKFKERYRWRAGVEATMSEYDRRTGVKNLRVRAIKAIRFCATLKALGVNIIRQLP
jgi:hypothetical protein